MLNNLSKIKKAIKFSEQYKKLKESGEMLKSIQLEKSFLQSIKLYKECRFYQPYSDIK